MGLKVVAARAGIGVLALTYGLADFTPPYALAASSVKVAGLNTPEITKDPQAVSAARVDEQRLVTFFFSERAWGGLPFSEAEKQQVMAEAMVTGKLAHIEADVTHLLSAPEARVQRFVAVFEVDGSVRPPLLRSGYELELLVPHSRKALSVELENGETGIVNRVEVEPDGSL